MSDPQLSDYLTRTLHLIGLCLAPSSLSPDPGPATSTQGLVAAAALTLLLVLAVRIRRALEGKLAGAAAGVICVAVAAALGASMWTFGQAGPLGRAVPFVAPLVWGAVALVAAALAHRLLLPKVQLKAAIVVACLILAFGAVFLVSARSLLGSRDAMWRRALDLDPTHEVALLRVAAPLAAKSSHQDLLDLAGRCIGERRDVCVCHGLRALALLRLGRIPEGRADLQATMAFCGDHPLVSATLGHGLALSGAHKQALEEVGRAKQQLGSRIDEPSLLASEYHYARALALEGVGQRKEALEAAERAIQTGGGRDARLLAAAVAIGAGKPDVANHHIDKILAEDPGDADAVYNRALVAHNRGDYNRAREGYLATLRLEPKYAVARYNLVVLTWRQGVKPESRHHAQQFTKDYPNDPRGAELMAIVADKPKPTIAPKPTAVPEPAPN